MTSHNTEASLPHYPKMAFKYNYAILCRIPNSFNSSSSQRQEQKGPLDIEAARKEHNDLIDVLKKCEIRTIILEETEDYPDCAFVGDCAVVIGGTALITRPAATARQGEVKEIRRVLRNDLKLKICEITDSDAILDGGDVLFTGKEIFVGIGKDPLKSTNLKGAGCVQDAFPEYFVSAIEMIGASPNTRLKSMVNMAGKEIIAVGNSPAAKNVFTAIKKQAQYSYKILQLKSDVATDMIYANSRLIHRTRQEIGEQSYSILDEKITYTKHNCCLNEIGHSMGQLSSLVLLVDKHRNPKEIVSNLTPQDVTAYAEITNL